jgi:hypothetical protein
LRGIPFAEVILDTTGKHVVLSMSTAKPTGA